MSQSDLTSNLSDTEELDFTITPCSACNKTSTTNEPMVGCDACNRWFHYRCVGVTEAVKKEKRWFCPEIVCQETAKKAKKTSSRKNSNRSKPDQVQAAVQGTAQEQKLKAMEEEYARQMEDLENEKILREKQMEFQQALKEKRLQIERELREKELAQEKLLLDRALEEKTEHFEKMKTMRLSYKKCMDGLDQEMQNMRRSYEEAQGKKPERPHPSGLINEKQRDLPKLSVVNEAMFRRNNDPGSVNHLKALNNECSSDEEDDDDEEDYYEDEGNTECITGGSNTTPYGLGQQCSGPTKSQLAARSGVSKKLPVFTGKPEDWPLFYGSYVASNQACGFSDVENLVRLQESLKGPALESVRGQLILPKCVPKIIEKLRQLYGRPELILQSHLERIRKLDPPKSEKLASFVPFGNAIEQLCEHLEAADLQQHMVNPILIQDLPK